MPTTIHKTFEKGADDKRALTFYVSDGTTVDRLTAKEWLKFLADVEPGTVIRSTAVNATDRVLTDLVMRGARIEYGYWHDLGIEKNLDPEKLVFVVAKADSSLFREFTPRPDLSELRQALALRNAVLGFYGDTVRSFKQVGRDMGIVENAEKSPMMEEAFRELDILFNEFKAKSSKGKTITLERRVAELAQRIPECITFNEVAGISTAWITAATVVAYSGGLDRFPDVASFWHYCGQHVVNGKAPKKAKGVPCSWSPILRTTLYLLGETIIKHRSNPWRAYYDDALAAEMAVHAEKHPNCPTPKGHCMARAKRKMVKEIVKRFFLAVKGTEYNERHTETKAQASCA